MPSLSVASVIEKNSIGSNTPWLVLLDIEVVDPSSGVIVEVLNIARNNEDVDFNGVTYSRGAFDIELKSDAGSQSQISLSVKDMSRAVQARMQEYGGGVGFNVTVYVVNSGALDQPPEVAEYFQVTAAQAQEYIAQFTLGAENALSYTFPRRRQTHDYCQWRYKDPDTCAYSGGLATCDLTLNGANGCRAHSNERNFGAFPGIDTQMVRYG